MAAASLTSVEFQPGGPTGITFALEVAAVAPGSQAAALGVRPGWRVRTVDGQPPGLEQLLLARQQSGSAPYRVAFDGGDGELPGGFRIGDRAELLQDVNLTGGSIIRKGEVGTVLRGSAQDGVVNVEFPSRIVWLSACRLAKKRGREEALANTRSGAVYVGDRVVLKGNLHAQNVNRGDVGVVRGLGECKHFFCHDAAAIEVDLPNSKNTLNWISDLITSEPVAVELAERAVLLSSRLKACEEELQSAKAELQRYSAELQSAKSELDSAKRRRGSDALQRDLSDVSRARALAIAAPLPWPSHYAEFGMTVMAPDDPLCLFLSDLFRASSASHRKDLHAKEFCPPPQLEILQVDAVSNPRLMKYYHAKVEEIQGLRVGGCTGIPELAHLKLPPRKGTSPSWPDLNEHFLFHGATADVVKEICRGGFDPRRGGETVGRMFGVATYLAANASKADIYTEHRNDRLAWNAPRQIIMARALLGESHRADSQMRNATRPPNGSDGRPLDSVWADTRQNGGAVDHLEVMIYDKGQAYPEVVITYTHAATCRCAECFKRPW